MKNLNLIPSLPIAWPYEARIGLPPLDARDGITVPGFEGAWTLEAVHSLDLEGPRADLGKAFGRGGVRRIGDVVIRPYRRGGLMAKINARVYSSPLRFREELIVHRALWEAGFPTVEPLGIAWRKIGMGVEGLFFTRFAEAQPWPMSWEGPSLSDLMKAIEALSAWGLWAPDLNATNVMWGAGGMVLLDWDRADWTRGPLMSRYHARLARSLEKLHAPGSLLEALNQGFLGSGCSSS